MQRKTNYFAVGLIVASFLLSLSLGVDSASAASATITTNTDITLNASSAGNGVTIDEESIGITTTCNKGYNLTIATSTSTDLYLNGDSTKTAAFAAVDGTSALDSTNNTNKWGYTLTNNATSSTVFSPLSTTASSIRTISQTADVTSETIPIYYGIKTDSTVDPGTYAMGNNGTITYYLTMNPQCDVVVDIAYDGNNADAGTMGAEGTGVIHTGVKDGDTVDLIASNFSRTGYGFAGWSTDKDAGTKLLDNDNTNNPVVYGPQESVTLPEGFTDNDTDNDGIVKLYAVWLQSQGNLQGWMGCSNLDTATYDSTTGALDLTKNSVTALTDMRDHDTYAVARLADGKCWMIENLRLDNTAEHNSDGSLAQGYGASAAYGNFAGLANPESIGFRDIYSPNSLYSNNGSNNTINIGTSDYPAYRMPRYNNLNTTNRATNPTRNMFADDNTTGGMYSYGNYYTWHAAIADLAYNGTNNQSTTGTSLCPAGWHLPIGGRKANVDISDFWKLSRATIGVDPANFTNDYFYYTGTPEGTDASKKMRAYPNNFLYSGYFNTSSANKRGSHGRYWSSTSYYDNTSYYLYLDSSSVGPGSSNHAKHNGFSIRCTASDPVTYTLSYDANGGTGAPSSQTTTVNGPATFTVSNTTPTRSGYAFDGWADESGNKYSSGASLTMNNANLTLYAQWIPQYTVVHVNNCRTYSTSCSQTASNYTKTKTINLDNNGNGSTTLYASNAWTTISGWKIVGWNTASDGSGTEYAAGAQYEVNGASAGGSIRLYAHWAPLYSIQYDGNGADNPNGMGTTDGSTGLKTIRQINASEGTTIRLLPSNFRRSGYGFAGWSTNPNATPSSGDAIYGPTEVIKAPAYTNTGSGNKIITLYAIWIQAEKDGSNNPVYLQDFGATECNSLTAASFNSTTGKITPGSVIALTDKRDNQVYTVARLADGKCWMTENLRLEHAGTVGYNTNDSTVTNQSLSEGYGGLTGVYGNFIGLANPESLESFIFTDRSSNSMYKAESNPPVDTYNPSTGTLEDVGTVDDEYSDPRIPRYNNSNTASTLADSFEYVQDAEYSLNFTDNDTEYAAQHLYSYGNYYNIPAALANTKNVQDIKTSDLGTSICPTRWTLPSSAERDATADYTNLFISYGGGLNQYNYYADISQADRPGYNGSYDIFQTVATRLTTFPNNFVRAGQGYPITENEYGLYGATGSRGRAGLYASTTNQTEGNGKGANALLFEYNYASTGTDEGPSTGYSVRCIVSGS